MGKHRPVSDRIAQAQAQLAALMAKGAKSEINASPEVQAIDKSIKEIQVSMLKFNRWASEGKEKIANFEERAETWRERLAEADAEKKKANTKLNTLRHERKVISERLAAAIQVDG